jgi:hypothetical protein
VPASTNGRRAAAAASGGAWVALLTCGCTSIDPGPNFIIPEQTFDAAYFYCHVEPQLIFAFNCGPGDPSKGDPPNGCHYNPSAVSGMALIQHAPINCGGGDTPVDATQAGTGSPAQFNLESVSLEMNSDYMTAPLFVRPSGHDHPRAVFSAGDLQVQTLLATWASK